MSSVQATKRWVLWLGAVGVCMILCATTERPVQAQAGLNCPQLCGGTNGYFTCAGACCSCNLGAVGAIAALATVAPEASGFAALATGGEWAALASWTAKDIATAVGALGLAAGAVCLWVDACELCYCNRVSVCTL